MRHTNPSLFWPVVIALTVSSLAAISCSDDGTSPEPEPSTAVTKTIPPTGGAVAVEDNNGVLLEVSFPVGAVLEGTRVTLRPMEPPSGVRARFALEPAGLPLLAAATFTVKLPPGILVRESDGLSFQNGTRVFVPTDVNTGTRTLTASLYQLGFADPGPAFGAGASAVLDGESGSFIDVGAMTCQIIRDALTDQILRAQAWSGPFPPDLASPLILEYRAALQACESVDSIAGLTGVLREYACSNLASAETNSQVALITTAEELKRNLGFLVAAEALSQLSGADCHVQAATMDTEFNEFLDAYIERIEDPAFTRSFPTWGALWGEIKHCVDILALAQQFGVDAVQPKIINELFPALFEKLHDVALEACDADENNSFLLDLLKGGHELDHAVTPVPEIPPFSGLSQPEVVDQLLRCGSSVTVEARTPANDILDTAVIELADQSGSITAPDPGTIVITNDILGFTCNGIVQRPPIRVRAELPGHLPVAQLGTLAGSMNINVAATIDALPEISPGLRPDQFVLVVERDRSVCGIDAPGVMELCRVVVNVGSGGVTLTSGDYDAWITLQAEEVEGVWTRYPVSVQDDNTVTGRFYFWRPVAQRGFWLDLTGTLDGNDLTGIEIRVDLCTDSLTVASVPVTPGVVNGPAVPRVNIDLGSVYCDAPGGVRPLRLELEKCPVCP